MYEIQFHHSHYNPVVHNMVIIELFQGNTTTFPWVAQSLTKDLYEHDST